MTYALCLLYVSLIYIRPGELFPQLESIPFVAITGAFALVAAATSAYFSRPRPYFNLPIDWCVLGFFLAAVASLPSNGWLGGAIVTATKLFPVLTFYLITRIAVETRRQFKWLIVVIVCLTLFQATSGILQYFTGAGFGNAAAVTQSIEAGNEDGFGAPPAAAVRRVRGTGIFGDPNDLAMALVIVCPFLFTALLDGTTGKIRRALALAALGTVVAALVLTQSRGGLLGLAALGGAYAYRRFGKVPSLVVTAVLAGAVLVAGSSRLQDMNASEESAQGRIQAWAAGFEMLRSRPVLGVGVDQYQEHHELVAHNSFMHAAAELGLVGMYCFVGLFYWLFVSNGARRDVEGAATSALALDCWASGIGMLVCVCFLSRQYSPVLYVPIALGAVRTAVERAPGDPVAFWRTSDWFRMLLLCAGTLIALFVAVRLFGE